MAEPMKIRAQMDGTAAHIKVLMFHPMETGQRKDKKTGKLIPAHYIQKVIATLNGKMVLDAEWGPGISKNPFLGFKVNGGKPGDKVKITWSDTAGESQFIEAVVQA